VIIFFLNGPVYICVCGVGVRLKRRMGLPCAVQLMRFDILMGQRETRFWEKPLLQEARLADSEKTGPTLL
jgi:hypothetical protein